MTTSALYSVLLSPTAALVCAAALIGGYLIGGVPCAYMIAKLATGEDITEHGTGNVGAMNVKRTTGSWAWFVTAMVADAAKGMVSVALLRVWAASAGAPPALSLLGMQAAVIGSVLGHNYSVWLALAKHRYVRTGKGLATGGGALLVYEPLYFAIVVVTGLGTIALTRYMMAGQVAAALSLPLYAVATLRPDWPFCVLLGAVVYAAHHKRFLGLLRGEEPRMYTGDRMGPRG